MMFEKGWTMANCKQAYTGLHQSVNKKNGYHGENIFSVRRRKYSQKMLTPSICCLPHPCLQRSYIHPRVRNLAYKTKNNIVNIFIAKKLKTKHQGIK